MTFTGKLRLSWRRHSSFGQQRRPMPEHSARPSRQPTLWVPALPRQPPQLHKPTPQVNLTVYLLEVLSLWFDPDWYSFHIHLEASVLILYWFHSKRVWGLGVQSGLGEKTWIAERESRGCFASVRKGGGHWVRRMRGEWLRRWGHEQVGTPSPSAVLLGLSERYMTTQPNSTQPDFHYRASSWR